MREVIKILFKFALKNHFNILNKIYQKHKQVVNSNNDSQTINTTKPLHFQFYNLQFQSFPLQCTICGSYCIAAQLATNSDVTIFKVLLSISLETTKRLRLLCRRHLTAGCQ